MTTVTTYTVRADDTLGAIERQFGTTVQELLSLNPDITNPDLILVGQQITVPNGVPRRDHGDKDPWEHFSSATIAAACDAEVSRIEANWPHIHWALSELGIGGRLTQAAAIATVRLETGPRFEPIPEFASGDAYEGRLDLGNTQPGDGRRFKGRGYIQITGRSNYRDYGDLIGTDLVNDPGLALNPSVSAWVLAHYFAKRGTSRAAERRDWVQVRVSVLGADQPGAIASIVRKLGVSA